MCYRISGIISEKKIQGECMMEKKMKQILLIVIVGIGFFAALMNLHVVLRFMGEVMGIILPVIVGGILALFINVPMTGIEKRLRKILKKRKSSPPISFTGAFPFCLLFSVSLWCLRWCSHC